MRNSFNVEDEPEPDETMGPTNADVTTDGYVDDETALPGIEDESLQPNQNDQDEEVEEETAAEVGAEEEPSTIAETPQAAPKIKRRGRSSINTNAEDSQLSLSAVRPRGRPPNVHRDAPTGERTASAQAKGRPKKTTQALKPVPANRGPNAKIRSRRNSTAKAPSRSGSVRPNSRSLQVQRSETPAEGSGALITRSGRHSIKPLASWRGERAVFDSARVGANGLTLGGIKEIIRTDEIIEPRPKGPTGRKRRAKSMKLEDVEEEDEDMEEWERETGVMSASVMGWDAVEGHFIEEQLDTQGIYPLFSDNPQPCCILTPEIRNRLRGRRNRNARHQRRRIPLRKDPHPPLLRQRHGRSPSQRREKEQEQSENADGVLCLLRARHRRGRHTRHAIRDRERGHVAGSER